VYHRAGNYAITLTVSNAASTDSETRPGFVAVSEPGALARVRSLQKYVTAMPADGWVKWLLSIPLEVAEMRIRRGNERAAAAQMQVFTNRVNLFEHLRLITTRDAAYMREEAVVVQELLRE
jgi:PKD repeat protein